MLTLDALDMKKTIDWYQRNGLTFARCVGDVIDAVDSGYQLHNTELIPLSQKEIHFVCNLFPQASRDRSIVTSISGEEPLWFSKASTPTFDGLRTTPKRDEALSPTAIIPSYADYSVWQKGGPPSADIKIYRIDDDLAPAHIRKLIAAQGLVHELGHGIVAPAAYIKDYQLELSEGRKMSGLDFLTAFANCAEEHPAISHYASFYRGPQNKFTSPQQGYNELVAISEEMCESIAAHLLGFSFRTDIMQRNVDPLFDRPKVKWFVQEFLNAKRIN